LSPALHAPCRICPGACVRRVPVLPGGGARPVLPAVPPDRCCQADSDPPAPRLLPSTDLDCPFRRCFHGFFSEP